MQLSTILLPTLLAITGSAFRIDLWPDYDYQGTQRSYTTKGVHSVGFAAKSWIWSDTLNDECCIVFCRLTKNVGKYCGPAANPESSAGTTRVVIGCGSETLNC